MCRPQVFTEWSVVSDIILLAVTSSVIHPKGTVDRRNGRLTVHIRRW